MEAILVKTSTFLKIKTPCIFRSHFTGSYRSIIEILEEAEKYEKEILKQPIMTQF
jgi:hypothetical protein